MAQGNINMDLRITKYKTVYMMKWIMLRTFQVHRTRKILDQLFIKFSNKDLA